jgi:hypothetical protein
MDATESAVRDLFTHYEDFTRRALAGGDIDPAEIAALYTPEVIGASPEGVRAAKTDDEFLAVLAQGNAGYRAIGTQAMTVRDLRLVPIDAAHCVAHVGWTATYARPDLPETNVDFEVHYLVQVIEGTARVFGWVAGDETAELKDRGIL